MADGGVVEETLTKRDAERMMLGVHREGDDVKRLPAMNYTALMTLRPAEGGKTRRRMEGALLSRLSQSTTRRRNRTTTSPSPRSRRCSAPILRR